MEGEASTQFGIEEVWPAYWRVTFENGPVNVLDADSIEQLASVVTRIEDSDSVTVVVFTSANPDYFMAHCGPPGGSDPGGGDGAGPDRAASVRRQPDQAQQGPGRDDLGDPGPRAWSGKRVRAGHRRPVRRRQGDRGALRGRCRVRARWGCDGSSRPPRRARPGRRDPPRRRRPVRRDRRALRVREPGAPGRRAVGVRRHVRPPDRRVRQGGDRRDQGAARPGLPPAGRRVRPDTPRSSAHPAPEGRRPTVRALFDAGLQQAGAVEVGLGRVIGELPVGQPGTADGADSPLPRRRPR